VVTFRLARLMLAGGLLAPALASAQGPWDVALTPTMDPLPIGACGRIDLKLFDPATKGTPLNPLRSSVKLADFDIAVTTPDGTSAAVKWDGASHVFACGCQGATPGTVATVTATYPAKGLAARARVPGVEFQETATVTLREPQGDFNPPECILLASAPSPVSAEAPWDVVVMPSYNPLPIGACGRIDLYLFDPAKRDKPLNPLGSSVKLADFDIAVTTPDGTSAAAKWDGASHVSACGCQGATPGTVATVTATYPAKELAARARVPGVEFQKSGTVTLRKPQGDFNPPECTVLASKPGPRTPPTSLAGGTAGRPNITTRTSNPAGTSAVRNITTKILNLAGTEAGGTIPTRTLNPAGTRAVRTITTKTLNLAGTEAWGTVPTRTLNPAGTRAVRTITTKTLILTR